MRRGTKAGKQTTSQRSVSASTMAAMTQNKDHTQPSSGSPQVNTVNMTDHINTFPSGQLTNLSQPQQPLLTSLYFGIPTTGDSSTGAPQQTPVSTPPWIVNLYDQIARLTATTAEIYKITDKLETINSKICTVENALDSIRKSIDVTNERIDKVEHSCQFISNSFDQITSENKELKESVKELKNNLRTASDDIFHLSQDMSETQFENHRL